MTPRRIVLTIGLSICAVIAGCSILFPQPKPNQKFCTLIGCGDTLTIRLADSALPSEYVIEATASDGTTVSVWCAHGVGSADDGVCQEQGATFRDFAPAEVTITVSWSGQTASQVFTPSYTVFSPNGPDCEPHCRQGSIVFDLSQQP